MPNIEDHTKLLVKSTFQANDQVDIEVFEQCGKMHKPNKTPKVKSTLSKGFSIDLLKDISTDILQKGKETVVESTKAVGNMVVAAGQVTGAFSSQRVSKSESKAPDHLTPVQI